MIQTVTAITSDTTATAMPFDQMISVVLCGNQPALSKS